MAYLSNPFLFNDFVSVLITRMLFIIFLTPKNVLTMMMSRLMMSNELLKLLIVILSILWNTDTTLWSERTVRN